MSEASLDPLCAPAGGAADAAHAGRVGVADPLGGLGDLAREPTVQVALRAVREMLGMEVAYMSEIVGGKAILRDLNGDGESFGIARELSMPAEHTYCRRMLDGRLPNLIPDVRADDRAASLPITRIANVGAFATVPLTLADGRLYGTLCAASHDAKSSLGYQELQFLKVFARMIADQLERQEGALAVAHLAALVNAADDAIVGVTTDTVVTSWNPGCERMFGYSAGEAIGHSIVDLIAPTGEEGGMRRALSAVAAGQVIHAESRRRRSDGRIIDTAVTLSPIRDEHGDVSFVSGVVRDISASVREARYRAAEREVINALESASNAAEAAQGALRGIGQGLGCDVGALWEIEDGGERLRCSALWIGEASTEAILVGEMGEGSFRRGEGLPGRIWASGKATWIEGLDDSREFPRGAAAAAGLRSAVGIPLRSAGEVVGVVEFFTKDETSENAELLTLSEALVARLADALERHRAQEAVRNANQTLEKHVRERTTDLRHALAELDAAQIETVRRLSMAVEFRDEDTGAHIARISAFAAGMARRAGLDAEHCKLIERASPLHDVGKVAIPDRVLLKPGGLTPPERSVIETHAEIGHRLLDGSGSAVLQLAASIALTHHEHFDGGGYPHGLAGQDIPIEGRIVAIADVFDALTSDRVYRPAMSVDRALGILRAGRGTHFDPTLLDYFLTDMSEPETST